MQYRMMRSSLMTVFALLAAVLFGTTAALAQAGEEERTLFDASINSDPGGGWAIRAIYQRSEPDLGGTVYFTDEQGRVTEKLQLPPMEHTERGLAATTDTGHVLVRSVGLNLLFYRSSREGGFTQIASLHYDQLFQSEISDYGETDMRVLRFLPDGDLLVSLSNALVDRIQLVEIDPQNPEGEFERYAQIRVPGGLKHIGAERLLLGHRSATVFSGFDMTGKFRGRLYLDLTHPRLSAARINLTKRSDVLWLDELGGDLYGEFMDFSPVEISPRDVSVNWIDSRSEKEILARWGPEGRLKRAVALFDYWSQTDLGPNRMALLPVSFEGDKEIIVLAPDGVRRVWRLSVDGLYPRQEVSEEIGAVLDYLQSEPEGPELPEKQPGSGAAAGEEEILQVRNSGERTVVLRTDPREVGTDALILDGAGELLAEMELEHPADILNTLEEEKVSFAHQAKTVTVAETEAFWPRESDAGTGLSLLTYHYYYTEEGQQHKLYAEHFGPSGELEKIRVLDRPEWLQSAGITLGERQNIRFNYDTTGAELIVWIRLKDWGHGAGVPDWPVRERVDWVLHRCELDRLSFRLSSCEERVKRPSYTLLDPVSIYRPLPGGETAVTAISGHWAPIRSEEPVYFRGTFPWKDGRSELRFSDLGEEPVSYSRPWSVVGYSGGFLGLLTLSDTVRLAGMKVRGREDRSHSYALTRWDAEGKLLCSYGLPHGLEIDPDRILSTEHGFWLRKDRPEPASGLYGYLLDSGKFVEVDASGDGLELEEEPAIPGGLRAAFEYLTSETCAAPPEE